MYLFSSQVHALVTWIVKINNKKENNIKETLLNYHTLNTVKKVYDQ